MMKTPITVITPSYQQGKFLERTIQSVISQNIAGLEYLVMDGGSQDESTDILKRYAESLSWISERDNGQAHAVNKGLQKAQGEIIGWLNSDDVYYPQAIQTVLDYFEAHKDVDVVYGNANHIDENDQLIAAYPVEDWDVSRLTKTCFLSQPAVFFRKAVVTQYGLLNEKLNYCMDYEFWLRLAMQGARFALIPQVLAGSRLHAATKTLSAPESAHKEAIAMLRENLGYAPALWLITYAVSVVKSQTPWHAPQLRYLFAVWLLATKQSLRVNGLLRGAIDFFLLPKAMYALKK